MPSFLKALFKVYQQLTEDTVGEFSLKYYVITHRTDFVLTYHNIVKLESSNDQDRTKFNSLRMIHHDLV